MKITVSKVSLGELGVLRSNFLNEVKIQFTYDKCHLYGWADTYLINIDQQVAGYASAWGDDDRSIRDTLFEFYLEPKFREFPGEIFSKVVQETNVKSCICQSNDKFLFPMFQKFATVIAEEAILFEEDRATNFEIAGAQLVAMPLAQNRFDLQYVIRIDGVDVADGGLLLNYNYPYADIYYAVAEEHRRKGFGTFMVQELKKEAYRIGRVPAARCNITNDISKRTMQKAGLRICGHRLTGHFR